MSARVRHLIWLAALAVAWAAWFAPSANAAPPPPSSDPFYSYSGSLAAFPPGAVLRTRQVAVSVAGTPQAYPGTQVLYRTTDQLGAPSATVATIIRPTTAALGVVKLLSYQTFYDGVASTCRPSYTLQGGDPGNTTASADEAIILNYVQQGFTVVTSDYEGPTDDYGAGRQSGYGTLDAIRAAEQELGLMPAAPVGLLGYSGGSIASEWAGELQPSYAPELHLIGIAEGGIPVDYAHVLGYINGSSDWSGAIPAVSLGLLRAYKLDFTKYASAKGVQIYRQVSQGCLDPTAYPGLKLEDLLKPQYKDWKKVPLFERIFNDHIMGQAGRPKEPMLMGVGNADGTGDGVMIAKDVQELAYLFCTRNVPVELRIYNGDDHVHAAPKFESAAVQFLNTLYAGQSVTSDCGTFGPGNPLTPLPFVASHSASPHIHLRAVSVSRRLHGLAVVLDTDRGTVRHVTIELRRHGRLVSRRTLRRLDRGDRRVVLRVHGAIPPRGHYRLQVLAGGKAVIRRGVKIGHAR